MANSISLAVLVLVVVTLIRAFLRMHNTRDVAAPGWVAALLAATGLGIAAHLA